jgi:ABC-type bacteriocin/lantibiotic exporter with double-glycine peptidase domain
MPIRLLPVEHRLQEEKAGCLAACAQMALHHLGISIAQRQLNRLFDLGEVGTQFSRIQRLARYGVQITLQAGDEDGLKQAIDQGLPSILFVRTNQLTTYWQADVRHALLVVGYDETHFYLNDPAFSDAPKRVPVDEVMLAWLEFDYIYARLTR